jgi:hypothetical protein
LVTLKRIPFLSRIKHIPEILLLAFCLIRGPVAWADTWTVYPDGSGTAPTIAAAIDSAHYEGDIIELADGVFTGEGNRDLYAVEQMFIIKSMSGNPEACIIDVEGSPQEPHWGIVFDGGG